MLGSIAVLMILSLISMLLLIFIPPQKMWADSSSPLNLFMFQEPNVVYPNQFVNLWITKPWKSDGDKIPCRVEGSGDTYIIYSHGNAENLLTALPLTTLLAEKCKATVISYDYSGYGLNKFESEERSAEGINAGLRAVYNHVLSLDVSPQNIFLLGYSLGTGCSVQVASELGSGLGGLILIAAYSSILEMVKEIVTAKLGPKAGTQISGLFSERWNNVRTIPNVSVPILIMHGKYDQLVPLKHAQRIKQANQNAKLIETECGHTSFNWLEIAQNILDWKLRL